MNLAQNKKALFDYEILERLEAGIILSGQEVKSAKNGSINLKGAFITFHGKEAFIIGCHIAKFKPAGKLDEYEPDHTRKLLLKRREINYLRGKSQEQGLTIVPLSVYTKDRLIKLEIAVARGKKQYDKRDAIKKRDLNRDIQRLGKEA